MLFFSHFEVDPAAAKCCFSSTMKRHLVYSLAGILATGGFFSCSTPNGGGAYRPVPAAGVDSLAAEAGRSQAPAPAERPGLATGWGREKSSPIHTQGFVRSSSRPAGVDAIYYNNPEGIKAMTRVPERVGGMQAAAGGLVEWGMKGRVGLLPAYKEWGGGRRLVAGAAGSTYGIQIRNCSRSTLEVVASVDGLDVMDGAAASYRKRGYLIEPGRTLDIDGFRTSHHSVAAFQFSSVADSYANLRHGDTRNVGVIGLAVFTQKGVDPWTWMPAEVDRRNTAQPFAVAPR